MKKKTFLSGLLIIFLVSSSFSQTVENYKDLKKLVSDILSDPILNKPYETTTDHQEFKKRGMELVIDRKYDTILNICNTKRFSSFMVILNEDSIIRPTSDSERLEYLDAFRKSLPREININPDIINESYLLGDHSRGETWSFINNKGEISRMTVMFINGQITTFLFTL